MFSKISAAKSWVLVQNTATSCSHTSTSGYLKTHACRQTCMVDVPAYIYIYIYIYIHTHTHTLTERHAMAILAWHDLDSFHLTVLLHSARTCAYTYGDTACTYIDTDNFKAYTYIRYVAPPGTFKTHMPPHAKQTPTEIYANLSQTHEQTAMRLCEEHLRTSLVSIRSSKLSRATETFGSPGAHGLLPEAQRSTLSVLVGRSCSGLGGGCDRVELQPNGRKYNHTGENTTEPILWAPPNRRNYNWLFRWLYKFGHALKKTHGTALRFPHQC